MNRKKLGVMGGAILVLLSMLVVGCKGLGSGDEDVESVKKYDKVWTKENTSTTEYLRFFDQFGTSKKVKTALVEMKISNAKNSKAGLVFSLTENPDKTVNYYLLGAGADYQTGKPELYLSYYEGVQFADIGKSSNSEDQTTKETIIVDLTEEAPATHLKLNDDGSMTFYAMIDVTNIDAISVKIGPEKVQLFDVTAAFKHKKVGVTDALGGIGAYGMLRPVKSDAQAGTIVKTTNNYTVLESDPNRTLLAAEDAE